MSRGHFGSRLKAQVCSFGLLLHFLQAVVWDAEDGAQCQCRRGGCKSSVDHAPSLSNGHVHRRTGSPSNNDSPEAPAARSGVARGSHRHRRQGSGRRTPTRRLPWHKSAVSKLEAALRAVGDDDDTVPNLREALKRARQQPVPLSIPDKVAQCESFLERAREGGSRQRVVVASPERVDTVECRGAEVACSSGWGGEDFVPQGRQRDLQAAIVAGHLSEVARISQLMSSAAQEWQRIFQEQPSAMPSAVANMVR